MPILESRIQHWPDEAACARAAATLAHRGGLSDAFIELHGPLGAGKTTFARHLLQALGVGGRIKSPTYAVLEAYRSGVGGGRDAGAGEAGDADPEAFDIFHFDFYRFDDPQEWEDAGFRDVFAGPGLKLAEWPEKAAGLLPPADLAITIEPREGDARSVRLDARSALGRALLP